MPYFDGRVIVGLIIITALGAVVSLYRKNLALGSLFGGMFFLSVHIGTAALAVKDRLEDLRASVEEGALRPESGFAALPQWWFDFTVYIGVVLLAISLVLLLSKRKGIDQKLSGRLEKMRTKSADGFPKEQNMSVGRRRGKQPVDQTTGFQHTN